MARHNMSKRDKKKQMNQNIWKNKKNKKIQTNQNKENEPKSEQKETERDKTEENIEEPDLLEIKIKEEEFETLDLEEELGIDRALSSQPTQNKSSRFPKKANGSASGTKESITPSTFNRGTTGITRRFVPSNARSASSTLSTRGKSASAAFRWKLPIQIPRRWNRLRVIRSSFAKSTSEGRKTAVEARL